jgi:hypothetical protein
LPKVHGRSDQDRADLVSTLGESLSVGIALLKAPQQTLVLPVEKKQENSEATVAEKQQRDLP